MTTDVFELSDIVEKINRVLEGLMNCRLDFQSLDEIVDSNWKAHQLRLLQDRDLCPKFVEAESGPDIAFPIHLRGLLVGLAVVRVSRNSKTDQVVSVAEIVTGILESRLQRTDRNENLRRIEENMRVTNSVSSNVIPLRPNRPKRTGEFTIVERSAEPLIDAVPLLVESQPEFPFSRLALELHEISGRWAFLTFENLDPEVLSSRERLKELGGITLAIQNLAALTLDQQNRLAEYLSTHPGNDQPQIVACVQEPLSRLIESGRLSSQLVKQFCITELNWVERNASTPIRETIDVCVRFIVEKTRGLQPARFEPRPFIPRPKQGEAKPPAIH